MEDLISKKAEDLRSNIKADNELPDQMETEEDNKPLLDWLENVCQKQFGLVDGLVANFIMNIDQPVFAKKLLKVLR